MPDLPPDPTVVDDDSPVVFHDTIRQIVHDVTSSHSALALLMDLLRGSGLDALDGSTGTGLAVLLESATTRMALALDGLRETADALGVHDAPFAAGAPG